MAKARMLSEHTWLWRTQLWLGNCCRVVTATKHDKSDSHEGFLFFQSNASARAPLSRPQEWCTHEHANDKRRNRPLRLGLVFPRCVGIMP